MTEGLRGSTDTLLDKASILSDLIGSNRLNENFEEGFRVVNLLDKIFNEFDGWKTTKLGSDSILKAFEFALASDDIEIARKVFEIANSWLKHNESLGFDGFETAFKAAEKCSIKEYTTDYKNTDILSEEKN